MFIFSSCGQFTERPVKHRHIHLSDTNCFAVLQLLQKYRISLPHSFGPFAYSHSLLSICIFSHLHSFSALLGWPRWQLLRIRSKMTTQETASSACFRLILWVPSPTELFISHCKPKWLIVLPGRRPTTHGYVDYLDASDARKPQT